MTVRRKFSAQEKAVAAVEKLKTMKLKKAAQKVVDSVGETLTYYQFPREHHRHIRRNNMLECVIRITIDSRAPCHPERSQAQRRIWAAQGRDPSFVGQIPSKLRTGSSPSAQDDRIGSRETFS